jgi:hypothetical protein
MFGFTSIFKTLTLATLAACALWLCASPADAGLISSIRTVPRIDYAVTQIHADRVDDLQTHWKDQIELIDWSSTRGVTVLNSQFSGPHDEELLITMLDASAICGIRECPVRVYTGSGELILETSACDQVSFHSLSSDRSVFIACGVEHRIEHTPIEGHATVSSLRRFWHNGSIVEGSFEAAGSVKIRYVELRDGLPSYMRGQLLFDGRVDRKGGLTGTAFTFRAGCPPAPYAVNGIFRSTNIELIGASPTREWNSCAVVGYTNRSPNARLAFVDLTMANR